MSPDGGGRSPRRERPIRRTIDRPFGRKDPLHHEANLFFEASFLPTTADLPVRRVLGDRILTCGGQDHDPRTCLIQAVRGFP
jgi:hypothetical protein